MKQSGRKFNLDIDTDDLQAEANKSPRPTHKRVTPRKSPLVSPGGQRSPLNSRKSPMSQLKAGMQNSIALSGLPSTSNYQRRGTVTAMKSPKDFREMWRKPEGEDSGNDSDMNDVVGTKCETRDDGELVFTAEAPDVDFAALNHNECSGFDLRRDHPNYNEKDQPVADRDILLDGVSTKHAYGIFSQLEEHGLQRQDDCAGEVASEKFQRINKELEEICEELRKLEKDELPTKLEKDVYSSKEQLNAARELRETLNGIPQPKLESAKVTDVQLQTLECILEKRGIKQASNTASLEEVDSVDLIVKAQTDQHGKREQAALYQSIKSDVDHAYKLLGSTTALTTDAFTMLSRLQTESAKIDLNNQSHDVFKLFDTELGKFEKQLGAVTEKVDKTMIDQLYTWVENSIEASDNLYTLLERLKLVETIHKESPQLWDRIKKIRQATTHIPLSLQEERKQTTQTVDFVMRSAQSIQEMF